jgi:integrase
LRPHRLSTLLGLLVSTVLWVGEALRLRVEHVQWALELPQLHILETKFHKSRIVPLHPSTAERLCHYHAHAGGARYA